jgi:predicted dienelactone hydrolase
MMLFFPVAISIALYYLCQGHFHWGFLKYEKSSVNYGELTKFQLQDIFFPVPGTEDNMNLHGWLLKQGASDKRKQPPSPLIIMSHGLGGQKDMGLLPYAERFVGAGFAVLMIDYRYFGGSTGSNVETSTRNLIDPWKHVEDIKTVINAVLAPSAIGAAGGAWSKSLLGDDVDTDKIVLWGTSFAGGHMLKVTDELNLPNIRGIISQVHTIY